MCAKLQTFAVTDHHTFAVVYLCHKRWSIFFYWSIDDIGVVEFCCILEIWKSILFSNWSIMKAYFQGKCHWFVI